MTSGNFQKKRQAGNPKLAGYGRWKVSPLKGGGFLPHFPLRVPPLASLGRQKSGKSGKSGKSRIAFQCHENEA